MTIETEWVFFWLNTLKRLDKKILLKILHEKSDSFIIAKITSDG